MNRFQFKKKLEFVYWQKEAIYTRVSQKEWNRILKDLKSKGGVDAPSFTKRADFFNYNYKIRKRANYLYLHTYDEIDGYRVYTTNPIDDEKNFRMSADRGKTAIALVEKKFNEVYPDVTLRTAFGYSPKEVKRCIPKSFYFTNDRFKGIALEMVSVADFCSQYPSNACGFLPDWGKHVEIEGTVAPSEQYPFAFYINSGHCAEYGGYDTHNWLSSRFYKALFRWLGKEDGFRMIDPKDDITILCPKSNYELTKVYEYYYALRHDPKNQKNAKLVMNASIGYFHLKNYNERRLAHIAAVIIARSNQKMLDLIKKIGDINVVHIAVDGIIYLGDKRVGVDDKALKLLHQEFLDVECMVKGNNAYIIKDHDGKILEVKHGSYDTNARGDYIGVETTRDYEDMLGWHKAEVIDVESEVYDYGD
jgi:hypothetical protein